MLPNMCIAGTVKKNFLVHYNKILTNPDFLLWCYWCRYYLWNVFLPCQNTKLHNCFLGFFFSYIKILSIKGKVHVQEYFWNTYVCTCIYILMNASARSVFLPFFYTPYWIDATCAYTEINGIKTPVWVFLFYSKVVNIPKVMAYQQKSAQLFSSIVIQKFMHM